MSLARMDNAKGDRRFAKYVLAKYTLVNYTKLILFRNVIVLCFCFFSAGLSRCRKRTMPGFKGRSLVIFTNSATILRCTDLNSSLAKSLLGWIGTHFYSCQLFDSLT